MKRVIFAVLVGVTGLMAQQRDTYSQRLNAVCGQREAAFTDPMQKLIARESCDFGFRAGSDYALGR